MKHANAIKQLTSADIGIITALPKEFAAVCKVLNCKMQVDVPGKGAGRKYAVGILKKKDGAKHVVAVALLSKMGNNSAAIRAAQMAQHCPNIDHIIMVGIAGAVPNPQEANEHVRLGDIVVSNEKGIIQYDFVKEGSKFAEIRASSSPPGAGLLDAVNWLTTEQMLNRHPWEKYIKKAESQPGKQWKRPKISSDSLQDRLSSGKQTSHPKDSERRHGCPRIFHGPIASANNLLKNPKKRDFLRDQFGVKAVEMEGSGIADATWNLEKGYLVIRGACDYCNPTKGNNWQNYAAIAAAAYARCVIEALASTGSVARTVKQNPKLSSKTKEEQPKEIKRYRDVVQLKRLFHWLHPKVMDQFIRQLGYSRLTYIGLDFFGGFERVVIGHDFHIYDSKLKRVIDKFFQNWRNCTSYSENMDAHPNTMEAHFRMPSGIPTSQDQAKACTDLARTAKPLSNSFSALQKYVRSHYLEIDPAKVGQEALAAYKKEAKRLNR